MVPTTADLYDLYGEESRSCTLPLRQYGGLREFGGRIRTIRCLGDNLLVRRMLERTSGGEVLVVDGGGSLEWALLGDMLAELGMQHGWAGIVVNGAIRDARALGKLKWGVKALGSNPRKSLKTGAGQSDITVEFGGVRFTPGEWLAADDDGILVCARELTL